MNDEMIWSKIKEQKIPIGLAISLVLFFFLVRDWHMETFVTHAHADSQTQAVQEDIAQNRRLITDLRSEIRIKAALNKVDDLEQQKFLLERDQKLNGSTSESLLRMRAVESKLVHAEEYRDCLLLERPNCEHLLNRD